MTKLAILCLAGSALAASQSQSDEEFATPNGPLFTLTGTMNTVLHSLHLSKDLAAHVASTAHGAVYNVLPPPVKKQLNEHTDNAKALIETYRIQYGVPTVGNVWKEAHNEYQRRVAPAVTSVVDKSKPLLEKPHGVTRMFVTAFEREYPEHKGKLGAELFDTVLILALLSYFVWAPAKNLFSYICCCGMCSSRKKPATAPLAVKTVNRNKVKKN